MNCEQFLLQTANSSSVSFSKTFKTSYLSYFSFVFCISQKRRNKVRPVETEVWKFRLSKQLGSEVLRKDALCSVYGRSEGATRGLKV